MNETGQPETASRHTWGQSPSGLGDASSHAEAALPHAVSELAHGANVHQGPARLPVTNDNAMCTHKNNLNPDPKPTPMAGTALALSVAATCATDPNPDPNQANM